MNSSLVGAGFALMSEMYCEDAGFMRYAMEKSEKSLSDSIQFFVADVHQREADVTWLVLAWQLANDRVPT